MGPTLNDVSHVAPPYAYRCQMCDGGPCSGGCATDVERVIDSHTTGDLAAVVVEPVMGEGGIIVPPSGWLEEVQKISHEHDALLIVDEVQSGYGRTGEMWASDHFDVVPDIMPQAKGIANGLPLGAFTAKPEIADAFESGDHLSTFGGNPVTCAAALETINQLQDGIIENTREQGQWLGDRLAELEAKYDVVGDTRGLGLMQGIEIVTPDELGPMDVAPAPGPKLTGQIGTHLRDNGIIIGTGGFYKNVLRFQPPLTISRDQLVRTVDAIEDAVVEHTA
jgi:4-aminobutyrate aminotransferase/4-aminobutyrate aminotransferase/(S)-3-amino-2-methylpropionate transaminase